MKSKDIYRKMAECLLARRNCEDAKDNEWFHEWSNRIRYIMRNVLPHGAGIDGEYWFDWTADPESSIRFGNQYHVMKNGHYDGHIDYTVTVKAHLIYEMEIKITGNFGHNQDLKEYLYQIYDPSNELDRTYEKIIFPEK